MSAAFRPSPVAAEAWEAPSPEVVRIVRGLRWLASPPEGRPGPLARLSLRCVIAPMTQLTFFNFDQQMFLFLVFHRTRTAVWGHGLFMVAQNLFLLAALREVPAPVAGDAGALFAALLALWYGAAAWRARLPGWLAVTLPILALLYAAAGPVGAFTRARLHASPAWLAIVCAALVALSHSPETHLPPRTVDPWRWTPLREYITAPGISAPSRLARLLRLTSFWLLGVPSEFWAALRLMPFNWLIAMMRAGYAPERFARHQAVAERAWRTGQPALDFVGTGGGTFLAEAPPVIR